MLADGYATYTKAKMARAKPKRDKDPEKSAKKKYLQEFEALNAVEKPGDTALYNLTQAAFMVNAVFEVRVARLSGIEVSAHFFAGAVCHWRKPRCEL